jgi:hypothetical protein
MAQKNTLFNYFTKSPAQPKVQSGGGIVSPSEANDKIVQKSNAGTPTSARKKVSTKLTPKTDSKKSIKTATPVTERNKLNEGEGNWAICTFSDVVVSGIFISVKY